MKHTKEYLDSKYVSDNPDKYDMRDVIEARKYIRAYEDGMKLATNGVSADVSKRYYLTKDRQGNYQVLNELAYEKKLIYG